MSETRKEKAMRLFKTGYNCSQAVFAAYADKYGFDEDTAFKISASFGGGMGRMREVCGAASGMFLVAGMETGAIDGKDVDGKKANYDMVQALAAEYRKENGSIICKELLGLVPMQSTQHQEGADLSAAQFTDTQPEARTKEYYQKRPCAELVGQACDILDRILFCEKEKNE